MSNQDAERYWQEHVNSGRYDENGIPGSGLGEVLVDFDLADLLILEDALHRRFVQVKKGRVEVVRAVVQVRRAMTRVMEDDA